MASNNNVAVFKKLNNLLCFDLPEITTCFMSFPLLRLKLRYRLFINIMMVIMWPGWNLNFAVFPGQSLSHRTTPQRVGLPRVMSKREGDDSVC